MLFVHTPYRECSTLDDDENPNLLVGSDEDGRVGEFFKIRRTFTQPP